MTVAVTLHLAQLVVRSTALPSMDDVHRLLHLGWTNVAVRPFLFRADRKLHASGQFNVVEMLVSSPDPADWTAVERARPGIFVAHRERVMTWNLRAGDVFAFKVRGHVATQRRQLDLLEAARREGRSTLEVPTYNDVARTYEARVEWLRARFVGSGCTLTGDDPVVSRIEDSRVYKARGLWVVTNAADFDGQLRVTDPTRFADVLRHGLSGCKRRHLGCGLLSIRRTSH